MGCALMVTGRGSTNGVSLDRAVVLTVTAIMTVPAPRLYPNFVQ